MSTTSLEGAISPATRLDKVAHDVSSALAGMTDGMTVLVGGFGGAGTPTKLLDHLAGLGLRDLLIVSNNAGTGTRGLAAVLASGAVRKLIASYPRAEPNSVFEGLYRRGAVQLELCPQGTLAERIRAGASRLGGFYIRTGVGTNLADGRETRHIDGVEYLFETPIRGDVALIACDRADRWGNLTYRGTARNFSPIMAMAADLTVVQARHIVALGDIDPEHVATPGSFVDRVVEVVER